MLKKTFPIFRGYLVSENEPILTVIIREHLTTKGEYPHEMSRM